MRLGSVLTSLFLASVGVGVAYNQYAVYMRERSSCCPGCTPAMWHLFDVGETKSLGYLDGKTIQENGYEPEKLAEEFRSRGLRTLLVRPSEADFVWGALYVYDERMLKALLDKHGDIVRDAGWPEDVDAFVSCVAHKTASPHSEMDLFRLIGVAFNDQRFV